MLFTRRAIAHDIEKNKLDNKKPHYKIDSDGHLAKGTIVEEKEIKKIVQTPIVIEEEIVSEIVKEEKQIEETSIVEDDVSLIEETEDEDDMQEDESIVEEQIDEPLTQKNIVTVMKSLNNKKKNSFK